jgi:hypothetical protein
MAFIHQENVGLACGLFTEFLCPGPYYARQCSGHFSAGWAGPHNDKVEGSLSDD